MKHDYYIEIVAEEADILCPLKITENEYNKQLEYLSALGLTTTLDTNSLVKSSGDYAYESKRFTIGTTDVYLSHYTLPEHARTEVRIFDSGNVRIIISSN